MQHLLSLIFFPIMARTAMVAIAMVAGLRILGKREIGQMNIYDLALVMLAANAVQNAMTEGKGDLGAGIVSAGTLIFVGALFSYLFLSLPRLEGRIVGIPAVIVRDGRLQPEVMRRERVTLGELHQVLREHELSKVSQVRLAVLEVDGTLSIVPMNDSDLRSPMNGADPPPGEPPTATGNRSPEPTPPPPG